MGVRRLGIVMNGVTGRMGTNQHLVRSILAIRKEGGVALPNGDRVMPDPILVGRNAEKIAALAKQYGVARSTTDLTAALNNPSDTIFFDAATTQMRPSHPTRVIDVREGAFDAVLAGEGLHLLGIAADQDRIGHHPVAVRQRDAALLADRYDRAHEVLVEPHASGDAVHDDAETLLSHEFSVVGKTYRDDRRRSSIAAPRWEARATAPADR